MRTLPIAFAYRTAERIYEMAKDVSRMTHWDLQAGFCCALYSLFARGLLTQEPLSALRTAWEKVKALTPPDEAKALAHLESSLEEPEKIMK